MNYVKALTNHYDKEVEYYSDSWLERWHLNKEFKIVSKILDKIVKKNFHKDGLDIACHAGRYTFLLRKKGLNALGIDTSNKALDVAMKTKTKLGINKVEFKKIDATKLKIKLKFDIIILMELLHHLPDNLAIKLFKKTITLLKQDGYLIFDVKNVNNPVIDLVYKKYSSKELLLITRSLNFFERIAKANGCKIVIKKGLVTPFWNIEPFIIVALRKLE